jgi:hypothetical protein
MTEIFTEPLDKYKDLTPEQRLDMLFIRAFAELELLKTALNVFRGLESVYSFDDCTAPLKKLSEVNE